MALPGCRFDGSGLGSGRDQTVATDAGRWEASSPDLVVRDMTPDMPATADAPPPRDLKSEQAKQDVSSQDLPGQDLPGQDLPSDLAGPDAPTSDLPRPDTTRTPDLAKPDARPPDAMQPDTKPLKTCDDIYGTASDYILCKETATSCEFNANTKMGNCATLCGSFAGQTCLGAYDNPNIAGQECNANRSATDTCSTNRGTEICVCSRN